MIAWLLAILASIAAPADATQPAVRMQPLFDWGAVDTWASGCTYTRIGAVTVTAAHCVRDGWRIDGDIASTGTVEWAEPPAPGVTVYAIGHPAANGAVPVRFTLTVLHVQTVRTFASPLLVLMTSGVGIPCTGGASGMIAFTHDGRPIGPMSVYAVDAAVTGLPDGAYVCGFAI